MPRVTQAQAFFTAHLPALRGYVEANRNGKSNKEGPAFTGAGNCLANIERDYARRNAGHWFDADTIRYFRTTFPSGFWDVREAGVTLFVTGERDSWSGDPRRYSIRAYFWDSAEVETVGPFCEMTLRTAESAIILFVNALKEA
jgi:hypothetical protein